MLKICKYILILTGLLWLSGCDPSGKFTYKDYVNSFTVVIDLNEGRVFDGHQYWPLQNCDEEYFCIRNYSMFFAVPKNISALSSWELNGASYKLLGERKVKLLGMEVPALLIEQKQDDEKTWFLYSKEKGLIGFGTYQDERPTTFFWLQNECGFGGAEKC